MTSVRIRRPGGESVDFDSNASLYKSIIAYDHFQSNTRYLEHGNSYGNVRATMEETASDNQKILSHLGAELVNAIIKDEPVEHFLARAVRAFVATAKAVSAV